MKKLGEPGVRIDLSSYIISWIVSARKLAIYWNNMRKWRKTSSRKCVNLRGRVDSLRKLAWPALICVTRHHFLEDYRVKFGQNCNCSGRRWTLFLTNRNGPRSHVSAAVIRMIEDRTGSNSKRFLPCQFANWPEQLHKFFYCAEKFSTQKGFARLIRQNGGFRADTK